MKKIKTIEEIEKRYEGLNQRMKDNLPTDEDISKLRKITEGEGSAIDVIATMQLKTADSISIDAQRYALEWVMGHHD